MECYIKNNQYTVEVTSTTRPVGTLREETDRRARDLYAAHGKPMICFSGGLDSQVTVFSFLSQDIPFECSFLHLPGYNDNELDNVRTLESKWGFNCAVKTIDIDARRLEIIKLAEQMDVHYNHVVQFMFVNELNYNGLIIYYGLPAPWIITNKETNTHDFYCGYTDPDFTRDRAMKHVSGNKILEQFCDDNILLSIIDDSVFYDFFKFNRYFSGPNYKIPNDVFRYDLFVKPWMYFKHWGENFTYFSKYAGYEKIAWIMEESIKFHKRGPHLRIPINDLINHLKLRDGSIRRWSNQCKL
jgi:hypothetical protein